MQEPKSNIRFILTVSNKSVVFTGYAVLVVADPNANGAADVAADPPNANG